MPSSNLVDLISCVPGDYAFHRAAYDRPEGFNFDLDVTKRFCEEHGFFFRAIPGVEVEITEAFFVNIRR